MVEYELESLINSLKFENRLLNNYLKWNFDLILVKIMVILKLD